MEILIILLIAGWITTKAIHEGKLDHKYADRGDVSPRLRAKYGSKEAAQARVAKYGLGAHIRDAWRDYWPRRTEALIAARDARAADGRKPRWRDRTAAARQVVANGPAEGQTPSALPPPAAVPVPVPVQPDNPTSDQAVPPEPDTTPEPTPDDLPEVAEPTTQTAPTNHGGTTMSAPTGEAVNYETTVAELEAMIAEMQTQVDQATEALAKIAAAKAAVDAMQQNYQATANAAGTKLDHETAMNLDGTTLGHAGATVDALPPNAVDGLYDQAEVLEQAITERLHQAEAALASLQAELAHLTMTYGDAHATVAGNLGGNSQFLGSTGGTSTSTTTSSAPPASASQPEPVGANR